MPAEAFRDLWATLQEGIPWSGMVKNRRKKGDHYWVLANVTPVLDSGRVVSYMSVRSKPSREQVAAAEALYGRMRAHPEHYSLHQGVLRTKTLSHRLRSAFQWGLGARIRIAGVSAAGTLVSCTLAASPLPTTLVLPAALSIAAGAALWLRHLALVPLRDAIDAVHRQAAGQLGMRQTAAGVRVVGQLRRGLAQLDVNLQAIVGDMRREVEGIQAASEEIAASNADLGIRTEMQAAQLQHSVSSAKQTTTALRSSAGHVEAARSLAQQASEAARQGGRSMEELVERMAQFNEASHRIGEIIQVVYGISFQTKLLALNAAVEAARAGQAGRGFAVVAGEVRALTQKTSDATREIKALVKEATQRVDAGNALVETTGNTVQQSAQAAEQVFALIARISHSVHEQAQAMMQVNAALTGLDDVTQRNTTMVEEIATATQSLNRQAQVVTASVHVFRATPDHFGTATTAAAGAGRCDARHDLDSSSRIDPTSPTPRRDAVSLASPTSTT
jgi:aerotaxis receptor